MFRSALIALIVICLPIAGNAKVIDLSKAPAYPQLYKPESLAVKSPRDLVLLGADLVEVAVALGAADRILARPDPIDLPGISGTPNKMREWAGVEGVAALRPGLVIGSSVINTRLLDGLKSIGIETDLIDRTLPAVDKVARMAKHLNAEERGAALIANIKEDYQDAKAPQINGRPIRILHASKMGAGSSFTAGGAKTAVHNLIERVGALNAAAEIGRDRYRPITPEGVMAMAPDVVIISAAEVSSFGNMDSFWEDYPGLAFTPAAEHKNLIIMRELHVRADAASSGIASAQLAAALKELFK
ncbi:hypothetical protein CAP48_14910 [Advenella sp. S44]|uniref:ABC transporter substrate-binding protein n=1 Tax=Advenella sp. S44 TaxID=1982755 RepID=UPI000C2A6D19|nr:ABC transporter substrate-binding protein [Advenella sp. S44]PJX22221.1 hypothetical protein CAP48_14910 [Advenella sp. S44]